MKLRLLAFVLAAASISAFSEPAQPVSNSAGNMASKPLFRDPVYDGAADPVLIWSRGEKKWLMFYTDRRANVPGLDGVTWVHGTPIHIAESSDGGARWKYRGPMKIPSFGKPDYTYWAPDVVYQAGVYHMYLTVVPGTFKDWSANRNIVHLTSKNLKDWTFEGTLPLASEKVIDATLAKTPSGSWSLWYKNERDHSHIYRAESTDLAHWTDKGPVLTDRSQEGPKVFFWKDQYWMITDVWHGLAVYRSTDAEHWTHEQKNLLEEPGLIPTDRAKGQHADVVVNGERAFLFYFVHQQGADLDASIPNPERRSVLQVVELQYKDGQLTCDRNAPAQVNLGRPK